MTGQYQTRQRPSARLAIFLLFMCASSSVLGNAGAAGDISSIVVFGDSYEDNGLLYRVSTDAVAAGIPGAQILPAPLDASTYWQGRWSNGETLVEVLARKLRVPLLDYAIGGAKSTYGNYDAWIDAFADTGIQGQIDSYEAGLGDRPSDPKALYIVTASTNDYAQFHDFKQRGVLPINMANTLSYARLGTRVARNVCTAVQRLLTLGARRIVVLSSYAVAQSPLVNREVREVADAQQFTRHFDDELNTEVRKLRLRGARISVFDIGGGMRELISHPSDHGLSNVTLPCQVTIAKAEGHCAAPDSYLWWDELHPTARAHALLADMLAEALP